MVDHQIILEGQKYTLPKVENMIMLAYRRILLFEIK